MSPPLSLCIIASNEEAELRRCLASLESLGDISETVIVVDAASLDGTEKLAREHAQQVVVRRYRDDIDQKSACTALAQGTWILIVDPDEVVPPALAAQVRSIVLREPAAVRGYEVNRMTWHLGRWIRHGDFYPDWTLRLFAREGARWAGASPHGRIEVEGEVARLGTALEHYSYRDLADQVDRIQLFSGQAAQSLQESGRRASLVDLVLRPPARFLRAYLLKLGFLDGFAGFAIAVATSFHVFLKYAKLWELERVRDVPREP